MERILTELVEKLQKAHGNRLVSVILYGSAAGAAEKDRFLDYNVLCVLTDVGSDDLAASEPIFRWGRDKKNPSPLLLREREVRTTTNCFAIELHDMEEPNQV